MRRRELELRAAEYRGRVTALREALDAAPRFDSKIPPPRDGVTPQQSLMALVEAFKQVMGERTDYSRRLTDLFNEATEEFALINQQLSELGQPGRKG